MSILVFGGIVGIEAIAFVLRGGGGLLAHIVLGVGMFVILVTRAVKRELSRDRLSPKLKLPIQLYGGFLVLFLISIVTGLTPEYGLNELLLFVNGLFVFAVCAGVKREKRAEYFFVYALLGLAVAEVLYGAFLYTNSALPRLVGTFGSVSEPASAAYNTLANVLVLILPVALWTAFCKYERRTTTALAVLAASVIFAGLLLTFSRAAWIGIVGAGIVVGTLKLLRGSLPRMPLRFFAVLGLTILIVAGLQYGRSQQFETTSIVDKVLFRADEGGASASERADYWRAAVQLIGERPWLGAGVRSFRYLYPKYQTNFGVVEDHPHNLFLKIAVENGVPAALLFAIFLAVIFWRAARRLWRGEIDGMHTALVCGALGAVLHNLLDFNFVVSNFVLLMVFLGLVVGSNPSESIPTAPRRTHTAVLFAACFIVTSLALYEGYFNRYFQSGRRTLAAADSNHAVDILRDAAPMIFDRDRELYLAKAQKDPAQQIETLTIAIKHSSIDAELYAQRAVAELHTRNLSASQKDFEKSLALDPQNHLSYYAGLLEVYTVAGIAPPAEFVQKIKTLLGDYEKILTKNSHFAVLTDNPSCAGKLLEDLALTEEKKRFDSLWFGEIIKYTVKFGPPPLTQCPL